MRIDGTNTVPGASAAGEKRRKDAFRKSAFSLNSAEAETPRASSAATPSLETADIGAMLELQEQPYGESADPDGDAAQAASAVLDMLQHLQEDGLNARNASASADTLRREADLLREAASFASPKARAVAEAALTRAEIELAKRERP